MREVDRSATGAGPPRRDPGDGLAGVLADAARLCPHLLEVLLVDAEGMVICRAGGGDPLRTEETAVETQSATPSLGRIAAAARLGGVAEWNVVGERGLLVVRRIPDQALFVVLRAEPAGGLGRVRFAAGVTAGRLADHLAR